ncbi:hypothetical protein E2C01_071091 [Portunus trituberculatus]|uniref:Uncharacterized protein n=1 Tax=Portunus trituberculatus TaxID=210409 RepID=A0A5B7I5C2_PORTR|nr:hypothetical protein [Portunus trituberculatus]
MKMLWLRERRCSLPHTNSHCNKDNTSTVHQPATASCSNSRGMELPHKGQSKLKRGHMKVKSPKLPPLLQTNLS